MKRGAWLLLLVPLVLAARPGSTDDPESLFRQADAKFEAGRPDEAAELYDRAGVRTTRPSLAAYNLATARYRQAKEGDPSALGAAEVNYRACLRKGDALRARALFGLGNCLLMRATTATTIDRATLRAAMDRYSECLADPGCHDDLKKDARHNRAKARLLLLQAPPSPDGSAEQPPPGDDDPDDKDDKSKQDEKKDETGGNEGDLKPVKDKKSGTEEGKEGKEGKAGEEAAGKGNLRPPPPESADTPPLAREDAEKHLEEATRRIRDEAAAYRRSKARPAGAGVRDW